MPGDGEALEAEVERIYQLLGASTKRRVLIKTYEIDIYAIFRRGPMTISVIVECKEYNDAHRVSDIDMRSFVAKLFAAREAGRADKGIFVTTSAYSKTSLATAAQHSIQCLTLAELYDQLVDFSTYASSAQSTFLSSPLGRWYVDQTGSDVEDYDALLPPALGMVVHKPLLDYIDKIFNIEGQSRVALLGNFGTGKSSFALKYRHHLLGRWTGRPRERIPILVSLRDCRAGLDIYQIVTNELQRLPGVAIDLQLCLELQRMGRFHFILDGFDEMASKVDRVVINENLREIDRLVTDFPNRILLTCRTHFFQERVSDEFLFGFRVVYLTEWGPAELEEYLRLRAKGKASSYMQAIANEPTLAELARTPMLVDMILRSFSKFERLDTIDAPVLYQTYSDEWIVEQSRRRGAVMTARQRRTFVETLAAKLFAGGRTSLHYAELYDVARELSGYVDATRVDYFDTDARTSTFITRDAAGNYGFSHRSFMEYFVASTIAGELDRNEPQNARVKDLPGEVVFFLAKMEVTDRSLASLELWSRQDEDQILARNATKLLLARGLLVDASAIAGDASETMQDERLLLEGITSNSDAAMEEFLVRNESALHRVVRAEWFGHSALFSASGYEVEDLYVETMMSLWGARSRFDLGSGGASNVSGYVWTVARNVARDRARVAQRQQVILEQLRLNLTEAAVATESQYGTPDLLWDEVERVLSEGGASERMKQIFRARIVDDIPVRRLAVTFGVSQGTVSSMLQRARKIVIDGLRDQGGSP